MKIRILQRKGDKNNKELYRKAVEFYADVLLPKTKQENLEISVIFKQFHGKTKNESGNCGQVSLNKYIIEINKNKQFHKILATLAHEMVHVKQGIFGQLVMTANGFIWKDKVYKSVDIEDFATYNNTKWEVEAYSQETDLVKKFIREIIMKEVKCE